MKPIHWNVSNESVVFLCIQNTSKSDGGAIVC